MKKVWTPDILSMLIKESGKSVNTIAEDAGIGPSTLKFILAKRYPPSVDALMALADYFGVTTDFLCGRVSENDLPDIQTAFHEYFTGLVRCSYEKSLEGKPRKIPAGYLAVWPYNLLDDIFLEPISFIMDEDRMNGLEEAMNTLQPREKDWLLLIYKDGNTLATVSEAVGRSPDRVRQVVHKAVRKLRHPSRNRLILDGIEGAKKIDEERDRISYAHKQLIKERAALAEASAIDWTDPAKEKDPYDQPIEFYIPELTVRTRNCLYRGQIYSIRELLSHLEEGSLCRIRNLGYKSIEELLGKLYWAGFINSEDIVRYCELNRIGWRSQDFIEELHKMKKEKESIA